MISDFLICDVGTWRATFSLLNSLGTDYADYTDFLINSSVSPCLCVPIKSCRDVACHVVTAIFHPDDRRKEDVLLRTRPKNLCTST